jgi:hypothetical protein
MVAALFQPGYGALVLSISLLVAVSSPLGPTVVPLLCPIGLAVVN